MLSAVAELLFSSMNKSDYTLASYTVTSPYARMWPGPWRTHVVGRLIPDLLLLPEARSLSRRKSAAVIDGVEVPAAPLTIVGFIENDHDILCLASQVHTTSTFSNVAALSVRSSV